MYIVLFYFDRRTLCPEVVFFVIFTTQNALLDIFKNLWYISRLKSLNMLFLCPFWINYDFFFFYFNGSNSHVTYIWIISFVYTFAIYNNSTLYFYTLWNKLKLNWIFIVNGKLFFPTFITIITRCNDNYYIIKYRNKVNIRESITFANNKKHEW